MNATVILVVKRLATSKSTYKLIGMILIAVGISQGAEWTGVITNIMCHVLEGGCVP